MPLFQKSVISKYLKAQNKEQLLSKWNSYSSHFLNPRVQEEIKALKEEQYQGEFLEDLFVKILGYTKPASSSQTKFNLTTEYKNVKDSKKADGAIIFDDKVKAVIELKGTNTTDLGKIEVQAFGYKNNQPDCVYVITSNFEKLRFYIDNAIEHIEFNLFTLTEEEFQLLYLCLGYDNLSQNVGKKIKDESLSEEDVITKKLYRDYSLFKRELHQNLVLLNPDFEPLELFKKSQKLLDRFLFLFFGEDRHLLPPNSVRLILTQWNQLRELDEYSPLYDRFKKYFGYLNTGYKGVQHNVFAYNGGLFKPDEVLDTIKIDDDLLYKHTLKLSEYDFASEVDVNILGHIFENSLNELDEIKAQLEGQEIDKSKTKRKKDGVFYTPKYITKYIVENTVGKLCEEQKVALEIVEEDYFTDKKRQKKTIQGLVEKLDTYRKWLLQLTICDPACGSGAFLNQALDFLIEEHQYIDELQAKLFGDALVMSDMENSILENNLFGVDLNEESVEIAKLSLWLRTAQPNRKLNDLNGNIKCGNSLIDDVAVAGDKAFNWQQAFPKVFKEKQKKPWHITTAIHDSRTSQRMIDYKVREKRAMGTMPEPQINYLTDKDEMVIAETVFVLVKEQNLNILAFNVCKDHIHIVLVCEEEDVNEIVRKIKGRTAREVNLNNGIQPLVKEKGEKSIPLWTQKFGCKEIVDENQLVNTINYIKTNRAKHQLPDNSIKGFKPLVESIACSYEHAFREEYKGGFDVIIGNPPYVRVQNLNHNEIDYFKSNKITAFKRVDISTLFFELSSTILKQFGILGFITSNQFQTAEYGNEIRKFIKTQFRIKEIIDFGDLPVFEGALTYVSIYCFENNFPQEFKYRKIISLNENINIGQYLNIGLNRLEEDKWIFTNESEALLLKKLNSDCNLGKFGNAWAGLFTGKDDVLMFDYEKLVSSGIEKELFLPVLRAEDMNRNGYVEASKYVIYPYKEENGKTIVLSERDLEIMYPNGYKYLIENKSKLQSRKDSRKTFHERKDWYALTRFGTRRVFKQQKLVSPGEVKDHKFSIDISGSGFSCARVFAITVNDNIDIKVLMIILNSKLSKFYLQRNSSLKAGGYYSYSSNVLNNFPICEKIPKEFIQIAEKIILCQNDYNEIIHKFQRTIQRKFFTATVLTMGLSPLPDVKVNTDTLPKKLQDWYKLPYAEFLKELAKKKVKLSLSQEAEWEDYFMQESKKALELKATIDATDKAIDAMVYALYGLSEEEIAIVENS
jgi:REP element-mobilizing transposase RayT